jgi:hypothetical protein
MGNINSCSFNAPANYPCLGTLQINNQIDVIMNAAKGDSGALLVSQGSCPQPLGVVVTAGGGVVTVTPISTALKELGTGLSLVGQKCTSASLPSNDVLGTSGMQPAPDQLQADEVANTTGLTLLKIPGATGEGAERDEKGNMFIAFMVDSITPDVISATPTMLGGFPVEIIQRPLRVAGSAAQCGRMRQQVSRQGESTKNVKSLGKIAHFNQATHAWKVEQ